MRPGEKAERDRVGPAGLWSHSSHSGQPQSRFKHGGGKILLAFEKDHSGWRTETIRSKTGIRHSQAPFRVAARKRVEA